MPWDWTNAGKGAMSGGGIGSTIPGVGTAIGAIGGGLLGGLTGGKGKAKAPDYAAAAQAQSMSSRPNISGPGASQTWTKDANGRDVSTMNLTGDSAPALQNIQANMLRASQMDPTKARDEAIASNYNQATSRLDPMWEQRGQQFQSNAANSGMENPGTQAYKAAYGNESRAMNDSYNSAMANAVQMGNQTQQTQMQQNMQPFNQYGSLINTSMAQLNPNLGQAAPLFNAAGAQYGAARNDAAQTQGSKQGLMNGAGSLFGGKNNQLPNDGTN